MNKYPIQVNTQTKDNYEKDKGLTASQWKIYYYLLTISKYDPNSIQRNRFVYKSDFTITELCKKMGIKSRQTYYNSMKKLIENNLIGDFDGYLLIYTHNSVGIDLSLLRKLLKASIDKPQNIDLLRTFLIIKKFYELNKEDTFLIKDVVQLLGYNKNGAAYYRDVRDYIEWLCNEELVGIEMDGRKYKIEWIVDECSLRAI